jgi:hypothetical protein
VSRPKAGPKRPRHVSVCKNCGSYVLKTDEWAWQLRPAVGIIHTRCAKEAQT